MVIFIEKKIKKLKNIFYKKIKIKNKLNLKLFLNYKNNFKFKN